MYVCGWCVKRCLERQDKERGETLMRAGGDVGRNIE